MSHEATEGIGFSSRRYTGPLVLYVANGLLQYSPGLGKVSCPRKQRNDRASSLTPRPLDLKPNEQLLHHVSIKKTFLVREIVLPVFDIQGSALHFGTYQSLIHGIASEREGKLRKLRAELFPNQMPKFGPKLPRR